MLYMVHVRGKKLIQQLEEYKSDIEKKDALIEKMSHEKWSLNPPLKQVKEKRRLLKT